MAEGLRFVCNNCGKAVESWSDGNPYYIDSFGKKQYAYHPDHERLDLCIGNDRPHLCLACDKKFMVDSRSPTNICPKCGSEDIVDTFKLDGKKCPDCHVGVFTIDHSFHCIS